MVVVTGANGFIGSAMVWELNQSGVSNIVCCDIVSPEERPAPLKKVKYAQFLHRDRLLDFLNQQSKLVTAIYHMGASSSTTVTDEEFLRFNNTEYTQKLFEWCRDHEVTFIYASSASVYGAGENGFDDKRPTTVYKPLHAYGRSKANFDIWVEAQAPARNKWYGLRFFNVYGPNEYHKGSMLSVPYKAQKQIAENGQVQLFKSYHPDYRDGEQMRDFVYVKDITKWMKHLADGSHRAPNGVYNMGFGTARTWIDLAKATFKACNKPVAIHWIEMPKNLRNQYQYLTEADLQKWLAAGLPKADWPLERGIEDYTKNYLLPGDLYL